MQLWLQTSKSYLPDSMKKANMKIYFDPFILGAVLKPQSNSEALSPTYHSFRITKTDRGNLAPSGDHCACFFNLVDDLLDLLCVARYLTRLDKLLHLEVSYHRNNNNNYYH